MAGHKKVGALVIPPQIPQIFPVQIGRGSSEWGQDRVGLGWGRCPNVAPELREQLAQSGQTTDSSIPRAGATGKVSGRTEPEIASLAWRHWRGAFELMPERQL